MAELLLAPYLSIPASTPIGRWRLEPIRRVRSVKELAAEALRPSAERPIEAHSHECLGAVVHLDGEQIGPRYEPAEMRRIAHTLLAGNGCLRLSSQERIFPRVHLRAEAHEGAS